MTIAANLTVLAGALMIEAAFGYPDLLFRRIRHPVVWFGGILAWLERKLNRPSTSDTRQRLAGVFALGLLLCLVILSAAVLQGAAVTLMGRPPALVLLALLASTLLAQRSLSRFVGAVAEALETGGLAAGRQAVSHIVGRNPDALDEAGVVRAAIESLAENFSDAVVAPSLWGALFGLPGIAGYKAVNTADSMIGHRTPRHLMFGWAAARLDDLVNLPASRLAAIWLIAAAVMHPRASATAAIRAVWRDARQHRSPNAGWPEAAMAGALGLRLAGPRIYGTTLLHDAWMGDGRHDATVIDLRLALALYRLACATQCAAVLLAVLVTVPG